MLRIILIIFTFINFITPNLKAGWVFDSYINVSSLKSKIIKFNNNYYVLNNIDSTIYLTLHYPEKIDTSIIFPKFDDYFIGFDIDSHYLVFNGFKYIYLIENANKKSKRMIENTNKPFGNIELINKNLFTYSADLSNVSCFNETKTLVNKLDLNEFKQNLFAFPNPSGIDLSSFVPSKVISIINNLIAVQDISNYKVKFYDYNYNYVDSIIYFPPNWKQYEKEIPHYNCDPEIMNHIEKCFNIIDNYSKISQINTLNDSTLLITWVTGDTSNKDKKFSYYHDIWIKNNGKWCVEHDNSFYNSNSTDVFELNKLDVKAYYNIKHGYLYIIKPYPVDLVKKYFGKSYSDFENEMNNYYIDNELQYTCFIYKYVP